MKKKTLMFLSAGFLLAALYLAELSKVKLRDAGDVLTLDTLELVEGGALWDLFYRVRATVIDGQSASFSIPDELRALEGRKLELRGAAAFRSEGARIVDDNRVAISYFDLVPLLSMTYGCEIPPDQSMRWTIIITLREEWVLTREEMIDAEVKVAGKFRIDTSQPYNAAFFIDDATAALIVNDVFPPPSGGG